MWELRVRRDGWSIEAGLAKGREEIPEWYLDEPELLPGDELFMRAYWTLDSERPAGFTLCRIPWSKVIAYGERKGLEPVVCDWLWEVISAMDNGYIGFVMKRSEKDSRRARRKARRASRAPRDDGGKASKRRYSR